MIRFTDLFAAPPCPRANKEKQQPTRHYPMRTAPLRTGGAPFGLEESLTMGWLAGPDAEADYLSKELDRSYLEGVDPRVQAGG